MGEQRLAVHAAEQPARKANARRQGSKPTVLPHKRKNKDEKTNIDIRYLRANYGNCL